MNDEMTPRNVSGGKRTTVHFAFSSRCHGNLCCGAGLNLKATPLELVQVVERLDEEQLGPGGVLVEE